MQRSNHTGYILVGVDKYVYTYMLLYIGRKERIHESIINH